MTAGILRGIEDGWFMSEIAEAAFAYQTALEKGEKKIVGVNCHTNTVEEPLEIMRVSHEVEREQKRVLGERRAARDTAAIDAAIARMVAAARTDDEHGARHARRRPRRSDPRRDLRRPARRVGRLPRATALLRLPSYARTALVRPASVPLVAVCRSPGSMSLNVKFRLSVPPPPAVTTLIEPVEPVTPPLRLSLK